MKTKKEMKERQGKNIEERINVTKETQRHTHKKLNNSLTILKY